MEVPAGNPPAWIAGGRFRTTHWSVILGAGRGKGLEAERALEALCATYWYPLYAFARRKGYGPEDAQDLVQGFFARLLARQDLATVDPAKGRFRTFLLTALTHYLANEADRRRALKRGAGVEFLSRHGDDAEARLLQSAANDLPPDAAYERSWAERMLEAVLARLRQECEGAGHAGRFEALKGCLLGERGDLPYAEIARQLGTTVPGVKSAAHRLRQRFRELFREEVARTVNRPEEIDDELRHLVQVMTR